MRNILIASAALAVVGFSGTAHAASCSFDNPLPVGPGSIPFTCPDGQVGPQGEKGDAGASGVNGTNGRDGKDGRDGRDADIGKALAVGAALSTPAWLEAGESFSLSGGVGFSESDAAFGATGIVRIEKNLSAFGGGAVSTSGGEWAGRAGLRVGW